MDILTNPVTISVVVLCVLSLLKLNIFLSMMIACIVGGLVGGIPLYGPGDKTIMALLTSGFSSNAGTALAYVLLGTFASAITTTGLADIVTGKLGKIIGNKKYLFLILLTIISCMSQNIIPIHIAFIPILIPPMLTLMNKMRLDRRAAACCMAFGLEAPYITIPFGFGLIFQTIISENLTENGMKVSIKDVTFANIWLGLSMLIGLLIAVIFVFRKPRMYDNKQFNDSNLLELKKELFNEDGDNKDLLNEYSDNKGLSNEAGDNKELSNENSGKKTLNYNHYVTLLAILFVVIVQVITEDLALSSLCGLFVMIIFKAIRWNEIDDQLMGGVKLMGMIAFVMLIAGGYANVIKATGGVTTLVESGISLMGGSKIIASIVITLIGLLVTMGIGTSFGTVPVLAVLFVPLCQRMGFSVPATIILMSAAAALGDAGSPASDTTLGPTSGLNVDGQHDHIRDTCVPAFIAFNVPLMVCAIIMAQIL